MVSVLMIAGEMISKQQNRECSWRMKTGQKGRRKGGYRHERMVLISLFWAREVRKRCKLGFW